MFINLKKYNNETLGGMFFHLLVIVLVFITLSILYFYVYLPYTTNHGESITVPNVEGMQIHELEEALISRNLRYEVMDSSYSSEKPPLTILKQFPHAGSKVKENRKIYISINRVNPPTVPMPNITQKSLVNADAVLKSNELIRGKIVFKAHAFLNEVLEMSYRGKVIKPGDRIPKGSSIDLVVGDGGKDHFELPNYVGMPYDEARESMLGNNLIVGNVEIVGGDTTGVNPVVLKQNPLPGENILVGELVDLWIGKPGNDPNTPQP